MLDVKDFFIKENIIENVHIDAYANISSIIEDIDAFARTTYRSVYIIDYHKQSFLYVSDNPMFLCGMTADEVKELGYNFYINHVPPEDLSLLLEVNSAGFGFYDKIPDIEKRNFTISYDFHIINKDSKKKQLVNHQITPLRLTDSGKVWLGLCAVSISSGSNSGNIVMSKDKSKEHWTFNMQSKKWKKMARPELKDIERDVLKLSAMGYTMSDIANEINRSFDTVKSYRKSLYEKLNVQNIAEAISYAKNHRLI